MKKLAKSHEEACPYFSKKIGICLASIFLMAIDQTRIEDICISEDWDNCPMFLSRTLRNKN